MSNEHDEDGGSDTSGERRRAERIAVNREFSVLATTTSEDNVGSTWVSDLSSSGVFVHTGELLPIGAEIELRFSILLADPVIVECVGRVARHSQDPQGMGVEFVDLDEETAAQIEECLERRRPVDSGEPLGSARFAPPPLPKK